MSQTERIKLTDDGELLRDFTPAITSSASLVETQKQIKEAEAAKEKGFLSLMSQWEKKKPDQGMAKQFCTLGRGKDRVVICTNPFIEERRDITFFADLSYLAITKKGFHIFYFQNVMGTSQAFEYASNPFVSANARHEGWLNIKYPEKLSVFHGLMKSQSSFDGKLQLTKLNTSSEPKFKVGCKYTANNKTRVNVYYHNFESRQISIDEAGQIFNGIQDRIKGVCDKKAEELNSKLQAKQEEVDSLNTLFGTDTKKKRG